MTPTLPQTNAKTTKTKASDFFLLLLGASLLATTMAAPTANAEAQRTASYEFKRAWPSAVRFIRIDLGYEVTEKDADNGYILFDFKKGEKNHRGSLELIRTKDYAERDAVKMILEIHDRPEYDEDWILDGLLQKLRKDHGLPVDPPKKKPPTKDDDKGDKGDKDKRGKNKPGPGDSIGKP